MKRTSLNAIAFVCLVSTFTIVCSNSSRIKHDASPPLTTSAYDGDKQLRAEKLVNALRINKVDLSLPAQVTIELENPSKGALRVWENSNSWGAASWRVLLLRKGQTEIFFQNPDQMFTVNTPRFNEIAAGGHIVQKLDLNGGNWCGLGHCSIHSERGFGGTLFTFEPNDTVIVIYDVPVTKEAGDHHVWYGVIAATTRVGLNELPKANGTATRSATKINTERPVLSVEKATKALTFDKVEASRTAQISLGLKNISQERLRVWQDSNSWGAACWRILLIRNGTLEVFFQNPDQEFTRNGPTFNEIPGSSRLDQKLDLNGGNWCGLGDCSRQRGFGGKRINFEPNDTVIVIYDVPVTQEGRDNGVWYGVIAATAKVQ